MLTDLAWDRVSERKPPQRAGYASLSNTAQNASLPVSQSFLAEPLLQRFLWASCWCRQFFFPVFCFFAGRRGLASQWGSKRLTLPWRAPSLSAMILFSPIQYNSGVRPGSMWHCQRWFHWETRGLLRGTDQGWRMFLLRTVEPLWIQQSNQSAKIVSLKTYDSEELAERKGALLSSKNI